MKEARISAEVSGGTLALAWFSMVGQSYKVKSVDSVYFTVSQRMARFVVREKLLFWVLVAWTTLVPSKANAQQDTSDTTKALLGMTQSSHLDTLVATTGSYQLHPYILVASLDMRLNRQPIDTSYYDIDAIEGVLYARYETRSQDTLIVSYRTWDVPFPPVWNAETILFASEQPIESTSVVDRPRTVPDEAQPIDSSKIRLTGELTRGARASRGSEAFLSSKLDLQIAGEIAPGVTITGNLTDQNVPTIPDGAATALNEFDAVYLTVEAPTWRGAIGDIQLILPAQVPADAAQQQGVRGATANSLTALHRAAQGVQATWHTSKSTVSVAAGINRADAESSTLAVRPGVAGPYRIREGQGQILMLQPGSVTVYRNGAPLSATDDYDVDYTRAEITFKRPNDLSIGDRVVVRYDAYRTSLNERILGASWQTSRELARKGWVAGLFGLRADIQQQAEVNRNAPDQRPDDQTLPEALRDREVVAVLNEEWPVGQVRYQLLENPTRLVVAEAPFTDTRYYRVTFSYVGVGLGPYTMTVDASNVPTYVWVGPNLGEYDLLQRTPVAEQSTLLHISPSWRLQDRIDVQASVYTSLYGRSMDQDRPSEAQDRQHRYDVQANFGGSMTPSQTGITYVLEDLRFRTLSPRTAVDQSYVWKLPLIISPSVFGLTQEAKEELVALTHYRPVLGRHELALEAGRLRVGMLGESTRARGELSLQGDVSGELMADFTRAELPDVGRRSIINWDMEPVWRPSVAPNLALRLDWTGQSTTVNDSLSTRPPSAQYALLDELLADRSTIAIGADLSLLNWSLKTKLARQQSETAATSLDRHHAEVGILSTASSSWDIQSRIGLGRVVERQRLADTPVATTRYTPDAQLHVQWVGTANHNSPPVMGRRDFTPALDFSVARDVAQVPLYRTQYISVGPTLGTHVWIDENQNEQQEYGEFYEALLPGEGTYLASRIASDELEQADQLKISADVASPPMPLFGGQSQVWSSLRAHLQERDGTWLAALIPRRIPSEADLVLLRSHARAGWRYQHRSWDFSSQWQHRDYRADLGFGNTSRSSSDIEVEFSTAGKPIDAAVFMKTGVSSSKDVRLADRDVDLAMHEVRFTLSRRIVQSTLEGSVRLAHYVDDARGWKINQLSVPLQLSAQVNATRLMASFGLQTVMSESDLPRWYTFAVTNGDARGVNMRASAMLQHRFDNGLRMDVSSHGRRAPNGRVLLTGSVLLTARLN